ncbi:hypothetical protein C8R43DRAFT_872236 [Mycena crocata]|nr:hypothetical protein C8R43DRAFT_872236 [Mycena crocata]
MDISSSLVSSLPRTIWYFYVDHLWNWTEHPNSWVSRIAYTSRVLAIILLLPIVILTLLDLASYGIARTLGVIDTVEASTSDKETIHNKVPLVRIYEATTPSPSSSFNATDSEHDTLHEHTDNFSSTDTLPPLSILTPSHPRAYFTSEDNSLKLSGVGVFSPATSTPPSPTITRRALAEEKMTDGDEGIIFRKRKPAKDAGETAPLY